MAGVAAVLLILVMFGELVALGSGEGRSGTQSEGIEQSIGATLEPLDRVSAAALHIRGADHGLVVTSLLRGGPASEVIASIRTDDRR